MLFAKKKIMDGSVPLKYKRGKIKNGVYRSECLGYCVKMEKGLKEMPENLGVNKDDPNNITDFFGILPNGINFGVNYIICDGEVEIPDDATRDILGKIMNDRMNEQRRGDGQSTYLGLEEFCGRTCCHARLCHNYKGIDFTHELYTYLSPYYMLQFGITYTKDNRWYVDEAKALLSGLT